MKLRKETIIVHAIAWAISLIWIIPFVGIFVTSIRPYEEIVSGWWNIEKLTLTLENYVYVWNYRTAPIGRAFVNSFIIAIPSTIIPILVASLAAYGFSRFRFPLRDLLFLTIVVFMSLPQQMVILPVFLLEVNLGLWNTHTGLILLHSAFGLPWIILFLRNFFMTLPIEIEEAARIDGASDIQIFFRIVLPISLPALVSIATLQFNWVWNDFFFALVLLATPDKFVVTQTIPMLKGRYFIRWDHMAAASVLAMSMPLLVFALLQKYYLRGVVGGTIKG
ncbi:MAG: ABC transporter permease [Thermofilum sp. ex4484_82]|nr:carbohydrate ABC transporter permease [Thermoproteales archaeon]OYT25870.1 MAG: ABC transporter permease [Thermofilum sp. ex4484_82]OYT36459.1 MAG: ABC transporter permease [Archaeoglobales archaeon ex4484_92]RLE75894.1 MAG: carbohydrate ABC transporter permease [Thermoprotei archaeon]RLE77530.1 MAG: carbohydrate ABC transporter permease [Thermoprotei archaeon]